ncbi:MAG: hypothetical protein R3B48_05895 [Kofleriaceae bacterium]
MMIHIRASWLAAVVVTLALPRVARACLWDHDTLREERSQFPETLELITGKFLHHSPEFYRWRIEDRRRRLAAAPQDLALLDDLAVAYDKIGQTKRAIELMEEAARRAPQRYETLANLGTFYLHDHKLERGLAKIKAALEVNPDAHFGRERAQQLLVEYLLAGGAGTFAAFLEERAAGQREVARAWEEALRGVQGMMRFGDHRHPKLLAALGDLLVATHHPGDPKQLAARAYLRAADLAPAGDRAAYLARAKEALELQTGVTLEEVREELASEVAEAERWVAQVRARELEWIRAGVDVDAAFDASYPAEPAVDAALNRRRELLQLARKALPGALALSGAGLLWRRRRRRKASAPRV